MPVKKKINTPDISLYEKLVKTLPGIEIKGATMPYTSINGHMFSFLGKDGNFALRLSENDRVEFIAKYKTGLCEAHGTILKEYVAVPVEIFKNTALIKNYFAKSVAYVKTLKPKKSKK